MRSCAIRSYGNLSTRIRNRLTVTRETRTKERIGRGREINQHLDPTLHPGPRRILNLKRKQDPPQHRRTHLDLFAPREEHICLANTTPEKTPIPVSGLRITSKAITHYGKPWNGLTLTSIKRNPRREEPTSVDQGIERRIVRTRKISNVIHALLSLIIYLIYAIIYL